MPKLTRYTLEWRAERAAYELRDGDQWLAVGDTWTCWLDEHGSFSFRGRAGRLTLLKEWRKGVAGYWYAYHRHGQRIAKRYAGRSEELTFARLEELAQALEDHGIRPDVPQTPADIGAHDAGGNGVVVPRPLLEPKLQPPRLHSALVRRKRLLAQLDAGREGKLTLVNAPAGFGKTTLVRQWLAEIGPGGHAPAVAWLSLDRGDNDPLRFWRYVLSACRAIDLDVGTKSLALLEASMSVRSPLEMILATFLNELTQARRACTLVLEDYHVIATPLIHETVSFLLDHLPPGVHMLLITRATPPLPLARLRAAGDLTEIEAPELRFSDAETATFLRQSTTLVLPPGDMGKVETQMEGWPAGLRLLALALDGRNTAGQIGLILETIMAARRGIGDYFVAEVLQHQPAPLQLFVLRTSFLSRLTASLCDSVTAQHNSQAMLETLEQANLFLEPLDGVGLWYRYHALFAAAMQTEARRSLGETAVRGLLERAMCWYEEHAMWGEAIEAAFAADNMLRAADMIEGIVARQFSIERTAMHATPEFHTLQRWLTQVPPAMRDERPLLNLALAVAVLFTYLMDMRPSANSVGSEIERLLVKAERGFSAAGETGRLGQLFAFRSLVIRERGEVAAAVHWARAALDILPAQELVWRHVCLCNMGVGEANAGHLGNAAALFAEARAMCEVLGNRIFARANSGMLGWVYVEQNELHRATALFRQMLTEARALHDLDDMGQSLQALAEITLCWNDLDTAWSLAQEVVEATRQYQREPYHIYAVLILARLEQARGQGEAALARCAALLATREPAILPAEKQLGAHIEYAQARIALAAGDLAAAQRWRASLPTALEIARTESERVEILQARLYVAEGNPTAALRQLEPLLPGAEMDGRARVALEMRVPLALAYAACGQSRNAQLALGDALAAARLANAQRVFVDEGEPLVTLLRATLPVLADKNVVAFAKTILRAIAGAHSPSVLMAAETLSQQERRVLRLLAAGRSNPDIAADLVVSVNTVKAHVKNIYRKLNVGNRLEAAGAARTWGLL